MLFQMQLHPSSLVNSYNIYVNLKRKVLRNDVNVWGNINTSQRGNNWSEEKRRFLQKKIIYILRPLPRNAKKEKKGK